MTYKLFFKKSANKEWIKLPPNIQLQFKKKLNERLQNPIVPKNQLSGMPNCFKIKLRTLGYRLVYETIESEICIVVIAIP